MGVATRIDGGSLENRWHRATVALVSGHVVASFMFFLIVVAQTPGLDPPPESAALFIAVTTAGVVSHQLVRWGSPTGYPASMLTGVFVLVILAVVASGTFGPIGPRTNPVGPIAYAILGLAVVVSAGLAWRGETGAGGASPSRISE